MSCELRNPPLGGASIASGCTPVAFKRGATPHPVVTKGVILLKSERFNLRMTQKEKAAIAARAKRANRPISEFMIDTALNRKIVVIDSLPEMIRELKGIGRNLNQLTLLANMGKVQTVGLSEFEEGLADIHSQLRHLTEVL